MKVLKVLLIFTIGVLARTYGGVLQSDQKPLHENETKFEWYSNLEAKDIAGKDELKDAPFSLPKWSDTLAQVVKDIDVEEFLPVGLSYAGEEHKMSEFDLGYESRDATELPSECEPNEPSAATLPTMVSSKLWIMYAMLLAIMSL